MERVTFLVEETGQLISCMLNPETLVVSRRSGIHQRNIKSIFIDSNKMADDGLIFSGGGKTVLELELVFDISIQGSTIQSSDVRELTKPIWQLSENTTQIEGEYRPGLCRFVWGKSWNIPCVISSITEKFDVFDLSGVPRRSWLKIRLLRVSQNNNQHQSLDAGFAPKSEATGQKIETENNSIFNEGKNDISSYLV